MTEKDYFKYYIQRSDHYLIPKDIFEELFQEMANWKEESNQLKEVLAIKENQLEEVRNNKTDYTKVNILEMQLDKYKGIIEEIKGCVRNTYDMSAVNTYSFPDKPVIDKEFKSKLLQILDKIKEVQ